MSSTSQDELTLDNMSRPQLASMCVYMGLRPYGSDNFLRFQVNRLINTVALTVTSGIDKGVGQHGGS